MKNGQGPKPRARAALIRSGAVALACMLVAAAWAANRSARQSSAQQASARSRPAAASARTAVSESTPTQAPAAAQWRYDVVVERNLFMPPPSRRQEKSPALPPLEPMPIDALTQVDLDSAGAKPASPEWIYAGYATVDGNPVAIVQNGLTGRAEFLRAGETLDGSVVSDITPQAVQLTREGKTTALRISDAFTATPLNEPPKPAVQPNTDQGRRGRGGFPGGGGGQFLQRLMPALQNNPDLLNQINQLMPGSAGPGQPAGGQP